MSSPVDVAVVGGGAAGASCAVQLALQGLAVVVLEQGPVPRGKACGGGMAASVQRLFAFDLSPAVDQVIRRVRFTWCLEDPVTAELPGDAPFWIVQRARLDAYLLEQASAAGAELRPDWPVTALVRQAGLWELQGPAGTLRSRAVVIATGSADTLAAPLGLAAERPRFADTLAVEVDGPVLEPDTARFDFGLVHHGFCWGFPRQGGTSIGVGTFIGREAADADAVLQQLLPDLGLDAAAGIRRRSALRIWDGHQRLHGDGVVVVGDAASLCDPFLAEGIRPALLSGCLAAEALQRWLVGDAQALAGYSQAMRQRWGESMAWGKRIAQVFYRVPRIGYQLGIKRPTAPQRIAQILSGEMGYGDIAQRVIKRLLFQRG
ncbi:MAG: NAD(P)/FAD-dependent oxidoreductase [Cyanobacteria bacterium K_DeepCast_35m_m2_023]|nr:NAD(P)/FAD-dependent oxidoreductase [Cyanobacteria bacterium K_DeepCast_35m_m2_023]